MHILLYHAANQAAEELELNFQTLFKLLKPWTI